MARVKTYSYTDYLADKKTANFSAAHIPGGEIITFGVKKTPKAVDVRCSNCGESYFTPGAYFAETKTCRKCGKGDVIFTGIQADFAVTDPPLDG